MTERLSEILRAGVERGIITEAQREALEGLEPATPERSTPVEAPRGFNAVTVAYILGAMLVLFAFGWFLADRWEALGPGGVLAVSLTYTALFTFTGVYLRRIGFRVAGNIATILAVAMTPVTTWALQTLAGLWPDLSSNDSLLRYPPWMAWRWVIVELATMGVSLVALRHIRFGPLAVPIAASLAFLVPTLATALFGTELAPYVSHLVLLVDGSLLLLIAYAIDRRQPTGEDFALWFYLAAVVAGEIGLLDGWTKDGVERHLLPAIAVLLIVAALYLRRRILLAAGLIDVFWYLGYLAFDVFRQVVNFPVVLATFGLLLIVTTVWAQRRFPVLVERVSGSGDRRPDLLPGGFITASAPLLISVALLLAAIPRARERVTDWQFRERVMRKHTARETRPPRDSGGARR